jgi:hypothetical protein
MIDPSNVLKIVFVAFLVQSKPFFRIAGLNSAQIWTLAHACSRPIDKGQPIFALKINIICLF